MPSINSPLEQTLFGLTMNHLAKLEGYVPGAVRRAGSKDRLLKIYAEDPVFSVFGLDSTEYIGATLAGGTITSIHRKLGDIYEDSITTIFSKTLSLTTDQLQYTATIVIDNEDQDRTIDAYVQFDQVEPDARNRIKTYCIAELNKLTSNAQVTLKGVGMEVRHCYQTGDSKRAQADEHMARHLFVSGILPIVPFFCGQSNRSIVSRYRSVWVVKEAMESYDMVRQMTGYDFCDFLKRNGEDFRRPVITMLRSLSQ